MEFNKEVETLKRLQVEIKIDLKKSIAQLENNMNQAEDRRAGLGDKVEDLGQISKERKGRGK